MPSKRSRKKIKLLTLGCKVNQYETQAIREQIIQAGFKEQHNGKADIYLLNTCSVTGNADKQSRRLIRKALRDNSQALIIVTKYLVEKDAEAVLRISSDIKIVPNQKKHLLGRILKSQRHITASATRDFIPLHISDFHGHERAFLKIQDGCDNYCTYCKIPLVRGRSRSRDPQAIKEEVVRLVAAGFREIVLTGICLGDYRYDDFTLADILLILEKLKGDFRLRLSSIEPHLVTQHLLEVLARPRFCPHLHLPLQSGDDWVLRRMNRKYDRKSFLALAEQARKKIKDLAITTDVVVGFPGEQKRHFLNTISCLRQLRPLRTHIFSYSSRCGTVASTLRPTVDPQQSKERMQRLRYLAQEYSFSFRKQFKGNKLTVLIESMPEKKSQYFCGYTQNYIRTTVENATEQDVKKLIEVKVYQVDKQQTLARKV